MNNDCINILNNLKSIKYDDVVNWIRFEAGSNNNGYFKTNKEGALRLQQVPEEYASLLLKIYEIKPTSYLEVGIGNGGSWLTISYLNRETLKKSHSVDNLSYHFANQVYEEVIYIRDYLSKYIDNVEFFYSLSGEFLTKTDQKYDVIFIDADHSYEGVKSDYLNSIRLLNPGGAMIFHDINSKYVSGVKDFWNEYKNNHKYEEFIHSDTCGIGILYI